MFCCRVHEVTSVNGVMSARGLLSNPALYAGYQYTPLDCVKHWVCTLLILNILPVNVTQYLYIIININPFKVKISDSIEKKKRNKLVIFQNCFTI